jgi:hypothetical protein
VDERIQQMRDEHDMVLALRDAITSGALEEGQPAAAAAAAAAAANSGGAPAPVAVHTPAAARRGS